MLSVEFDTKDLGPAKRILGMDKFRDSSKGVLNLSQKGYLDKIIQVFNMQQAKNVNAPIGAHFKLVALKYHEIEIWTHEIRFSFQCYR